MEPQKEGERTRGREMLRNCGARTAKVLWDWGREEARRRAERHDAGTLRSCCMEYVEAMVTLNRRTV